MGVKPLHYSSVCRSTWQGQCHVAAVESTCLGLGSLPCPHWPRDSLPCPRWPRGSLPCPRWLPYQNLTPMGDLQQDREAISAEEVMPGEARKPVGSESEQGALETHTQQTATALLWTGCCMRTRKWGQGCWRLERHGAEPETPMHQPSPHQSACVKAAEMQGLWGPGTGGQSVHNPRGAGKSPWHRTAMTLLHIQSRGGSTELEGTGSPTASGWLGQATFSEYTPASLSLLPPGPAPWGPGLGLALRASIVTAGYAPS